MVLKKRWKYILICVIVLVCVPIIIFYSIQSVKYNGWKRVELPGKKIYLCTGRLGYDSYQ